MKKIFYSLLICLFLFPVSAYAADFKYSDSDNVIINKEDNVKNLYTAGKNVKSEADIKGDVFAAGGDVTVNGTVENDIFSLGGTVNIKTSSAQDVRLAGGTINFEGVAKEDLLIAGGDVRIGKDATIGGDLLIAAGSVTIDGKIGGDLKVAADTIIINGQIDGNVNLRLGSKLSINEGAKIGNGLTYYAREAGDISTKADIKGGTDFKQVSDARKSIGSAGFSSSLLGILGSIIFLLILVALLPKWVRKSAENIILEPWNKVGRGLFTLVVVPLLAFILMMTIIGLKFAFLGLIAYFATIIVAYSLVGLFVGIYLMKLITKSDDLRIDWASISLGVIITALLNFIPVIGPFALFIFFIFVLGEITSQILEGMKKQTEK